MATASVKRTNITRPSEIFHLAGWTYENVASILKVAKSYGKAMSNGSFTIYESDVKTLHAALATAGVEIEYDEFAGLFKSIKQGSTPVYRRRRMRE